MPNDNVSASCLVQMSQQADPDHIRVGAISYAELRDVHTDGPDTAPNN